MVKNMYEYRITELVSRKPKPAAGLLRIIMVVLGVVFVLMGIMFSRGFMLPGFLLVGLYFLFEVFSQKEYEYTMEGTVLKIDVIYGKRYRKNAHELDLKDMEVVAPNWHESVGKYRIRGGSVRLRKYDYTSYDEKTPYYTMIIMEGREKIKLLLDLNEQMLGRMKQMYPEKVFFA